MYVTQVYFPGRYKYDVDKNMTVLRIDDAAGHPIGLIKYV